MTKTLEAWSRSAEEGTTHVVDLDSRLWQSLEHGRKFNIAVNPLTSTKRQPTPLEPSPSWSSTLRHPKPAGR
jgi:hypothetical protein